MFGLQLVGDARPLPSTALELLPKVAKRYFDLMLAWGPGRAMGYIEFLDPTSPAFADLQMRYRLHAPHQKAMGRWACLHEDALETGVVLARLRNGSALVAFGTRLVELASNGTEAYRWSFEDAIQASISPSTSRTKAPQTYSTTLDGRTKLYAALAAGDEATADALMGALFEHEAAWGLLEIAFDLSSSSSSIAGELRATYFDRCMRLVKRVDPDCLTDLPLRAMREEIATAGALSPDHARALHRVAHAPSLFTGEMTQIERDLATQILHNPRDRAPCIALADHLETLGQDLRAALVREQAESLSFEEVAERGLEFRDVDGDQALATWIAAWGDAADPALVAATEPVPTQIRSAIVSWLESTAPDDVAKLAKEPAAPAFITLGLMSPERNHLRGCLRAIVELSLKSAAPHLLAAIRRTTPTEETLEAMASAYNEIARLAPTEVTEVLGWLESDHYALRRAACCLLQKFGKDDRVFLAVLTHFVDGHPYTERTIAKRKTDPRVLPTLLAAFDRAEVASLKDGRHLVYTTDYGVLSKYLAKLGNTRGKEAWERYKKKGRMDRASVGAKERREAWEM